MENARLKGSKMLFRSWVVIAGMLLCLVAVYAGACFALGDGPTPNCHVFTGRCTSLGGEQCVVAPESINPDAVTTFQCCTGWFEYPRIEVCEGEPPKKTCGFCIW